MSRVRLRSARQAPTKKICPLHATAGVESRKRSTSGSIPNGVASSIPKTSVASGE